MVKEVSYEIIRKEMQRSAKYGVANSKSQNDFLGLSEKFVVDTYKKYFPNFSEDGILNKYDQQVSRLVDNVFETTKLNPKQNVNLGFLSTVDNSFLNYNADDIILGLSQKGYTKTQVGKVVLAHILKQIDNICSFAEATNITLSDIDDFENLFPPNKFITILDEMVDFGFSGVRKYYDTAREIISINSSELLKKRQELVKKFKKNRLIADKVDRDIARQFFGIQSKEYNYPLKRSEEFKFAFDQGLKYLRFCHENNTQPESYAIAAETLATLWRDARDNMPGLINSHIAAITTWGTQLGRPLSDEDLNRLGITRKQFQHLISHVFDKRLRNSEASAYSITKNLESIKGYQEQPTRLLVNSIRSLLESRQVFLKKNSNVNLLLIVDDNKYLKINLPVNATDEQIIFEINKNPQYLGLNWKEKYNLKLDSYKEPKFRSNKFKEIYGVKGSKTGFGEYIVRLTTKDQQSINKNNKSIYSMYTVGPYEALIDINMNISNGFELTIKPSHHYFDGAAVSKFFDEIADKIISQQNDTLLIDQPKLLSKSEKKFFDINEYPLPIPESISSKKFLLKYQKTEVKLGKKKQIVSTSLQRALDLVFANNISDLQILFKTDTVNNPYSNPQWDNVQSEIISIDPIKSIVNKFKQEYLNYINKNGEKPTLTLEDKKKVMKYLEMVNNAILWAKRGFSTTSVMSSPFGTFRNIASKTTTNLYSNVKLLNQSNGMISIITGKDKFETAGSDLLNPDIDLANAKPHLGVLGAEIDINGNNTYTVKKSPNQAQLAFKEALITNPLLSLDVEQRANVTKLLNNLLKTWEKLIFSELEHNINNPIVGFFYEDYDSVLKKTLKNLKKANYIGKEKLAEIGIKNEADLQRKLNQILFDDSRKILNTEKLIETHEMMNAFFEAVNQH